MLNRVSVFFYALFCARKKHALSPLKGLEGFDTKDAYGGTVKKDADGVDHYYRNGKEYSGQRCCKVNVWFMLAEFLLKC